MFLGAARVHAFSLCGQILQSAAAGRTRLASALQISPACPLLLGAALVLLDATSPPSGGLSVQFEQVCAGASTDDLRGLDNTGHGLDGATGVDVAYHPDPPDEGLVAGLAENERRQADALSARRPAWTAWACAGSVHLGGGPLLVDATFVGLGPLRSRRRCRYMLLRRAARPDRGRGCSSRSFLLVVADRDRLLASPAWRANWTWPIDGCMLEALAAAATLGAEHIGVLGYQAVSIAASYHEDGADRGLMLIDLYILASPTRRRQAVSVVAAAVEEETRPDRTAIGPSNIDPGLPRRR